VQIIPEAIAVLTHPPQAPLLCKGESDTLAQTFRLSTARTCSSLSLDLDKAID